MSLSSSSSSGSTSIQESLNLPKSYFQRLPNQIAIKAAQGFLITGTLSLLTGFSASVALTGGAIAVTATFIEALVRPLLKDIFPGNNGEHSIMNNSTIRMVLSIAILPLTLRIVDSIAPWSGVSYKMTALLIPIWAMMALNNRSFNDNTALTFVV